MPVITIVPLRAPRALTLEGKTAVESAERLFLQTEKHPSAETIRTIKRPFTAMDDLFESSPDFDSLNERIARRLADAGDCVYVATGNIAGSQLPAIRTAAEAAGSALVVLPGISAAAAAFPDRGDVNVLSAHDLPESLDPDRDWAVEEIDSAIAAGEAKLFLTEFFPDDWKAQFARIGADGAYHAREILLCELDRQTDYDATCVVFVPRTALLERSRHGLEDAMRIVRRLRAPDGCPWDREQTHASLKNALLEECYELVDAIDEGDDAHICEELGDVLLQFALHAAIAEEQSAFTARDAATDLVEKLIYRHPHVFGETRVSGSTEVLKNWDALKMRQRNQSTQTEVLRSVPKSFPALLRSRKVQKKAADVGFDWPSARDAFFKIAEETAELDEAMANGTHIAEEMGDLLFAVVNVARLLKLEPEFLLMEATDKFINRFEAMEALAISRGLTLSKLALSEQDALWEEVKKCRNRQ